MNFVGIIAEYDPFHSGHALQLRMLRQRGASTIAVCMSTGVVQRGGVPILPEAVRV
ncbi:MAG: nucleotidyltransferase family protein, partial [Gemmiger qucibialis]